MPLAICLAGAGPARAESPAFHAVLNYGGYTVGMQAAQLRVELDMTGTGYAVRMNYRTSGLLGAVVSGAQVATAIGTWQADSVVPRSFQSDGHYRGAPRHILMVYDANTPQLKVLDPQDDGRNPVPPAQMAGTVDTLSAMALVLRRVQGGGSCNGTAMVFDGRRLIRVVSRDDGLDTLAQTDRSSFSGPARRCALEGTLLGGFKRGEGPDAHKPQHGTAWFAALQPGGAVLPVRAAFETPWVGQVTCYLTDGSEHSNPAGRPVLTKQGPGR